MPPTTVTTNGIHKEVGELHINGNGNGIVKNQRARMARKQSSPMMPAFMVSAPGKVIVFGEHSVVYGKVCMLFTQVDKAWGLTYGLTNYLGLYRKLSPPP